ncbi:MAG: ATP-binding protein [Pseudomonadota bacterium]
MPELKKPDMVAVLARTNLARHIGGFLLPVFEAVSNSIHSISEKYPAADVQRLGRIVIKVIDGSDIDKFSITISDNGSGLDKKNFDAFLTPFTGNKLRKNGKGFGRFIAFKVFERVEYESLLANEEVTFRFLFDVYQDEEVQRLRGRREFPYEEGCSVRYSDVRAEYVSRWRELGQKSFLDNLTQNFLTYLVNGFMPETKVIYNGVETDLRSHFVTVFHHEESHNFDLTLDGHNYNFRLDVSRADRNAPFERHALLFFADSRILGKGRPIEAKLGRAAFQRADGSEYVVIASVSGDYLDENANNDRTFLEATEKDIAEIVDKACSFIMETEKDQNDQIKIEQRDNVTEILQSHPLLRFGLAGKTVEQYVDKKPNNWNAERFVSDLSVQRLRAEKRWTSYLKETFSDDVKFQERKDELLSQVTDTYRDALSEYVVHRRAVIEIADRLRKLDSTDRMHPEDAVHELIFPRNTDSTTTKYYQHNLWLLDERLSFVSYVSSDRTLHGGRRSAGDKVIDISFYDEVFVAGGEGTSAVMVAEFKRPGRDDYRAGKDGSDPVKQVQDTVFQIRQRGSFVTKDGATIEVAPSTLITAFIIADIEPTLRQVGDYYDFQTSWDNKSMFHYHKKNKIYTEIFGYNKLLEDAKKRNGPFFDVLMKDLGN